MSKKELAKAEKNELAVMTMFNTKAIVDALVYSFPGMQLNIAIDEDTVIPLQAAITTIDKQHIIFASEEVAKKLAESGKGKMVFKAMTDTQKIRRIGI